MSDTRNAPKHKHIHPAVTGCDDHPQLTQCKVYTLQIAANGQVLLPAPNTHFFIIAATGTVGIQGDTFGQIDGLTAGQGMNNTPFNKLTIIDQSGAANTVKLLIAPGEFTNQILSATVNIGRVPNSGSFANAQASITTASAQLLAANAARQYLMVQNNDPAATIYLGFGAAAVTAANGLRLLPGQAYEQCGVVTNQAIQVIGSAATTAVAVITG